MKTGVFRQKNLAGKIVTMLFGASVVLGATVANAEAMKPSAEDIAKYLRPMEVPQPANNLMTPERVELGKTLFFDPRLSGSKWISCATCHNPVLGWSDGLPKAIGHGMKELGRATPTILNSAYQRLQFWDGRARTLEKQALGPIGAEHEMAGNLDSLPEDLAAIPEYNRMFEAAYPGEGISKNTIAKAIASFERTVVSNDAPFDRWLKGEDGYMSEAAIRGFELFKGKAKCAACHSGFNFSDNGFHNIGLPDNDDMGRYRIIPIAVLKGAFKTPTLRDVALTAPYMHNGQYKTLMDVIEHYNRGGDKNLGNLDPNLKPLNLTGQEKKDLVTFLKSLTGDPVEVTLPQVPVE